MKQPTEDMSEVENFNKLMSEELAKVKEMADKEFLGCMIMGERMWMSTLEAEARQKWFEEQQVATMWGRPPREPQEDDNVKLAWVVIDNQRVI